MKLLLRMLWLSWMPAWMHNQTPDSQHFYRRQFTAGYRRKKQWVRLIWLCGAGLVLIFPTVAFAVVVALLSTCLSFCLLDENQ